MSRKDYERVCLELDNTRQKDHPHAYDTLSQEGREASISPHRKNELLKLLIFWRCSFFCEESSGRSSAVIRLGKNDSG